MFHSPTSETSQQNDPARSRESTGPASRAPARHASLSAAPSLRGSQQLARLHSNYGNQAVLRMLSQSAPVVQTKLSVNQPGDMFEQEADRVADHVMRMTAPAAIQRNCASCAEQEKLQRKCAEREKKQEHQLQGKREATGPGDPFSGAGEEDARSGGLGPLLSVMESAFDSDFSGVQIHNDSLADAHGARAITKGENIHLSSSETDLDSMRGRELVGHELAHVLQQRSQHGSTASSSALESEADQAGASAAKGHRIKVMGRVASRAQIPQRKPKVAPAPPTGNILYVGMNNPDPEIKALQDRYKSGSPVSLTIIKGTNEEAATDIGTGTTFDLTTTAGIDALVNALTTDPAKRTVLKTIISGQGEKDRDDLAHVAKVYSDTEADGKDRMTRVVLSGHSGGLGVFGHGSEVYFSALVELAKVFPTAANQTKHLIVAGCHTGDEGTILDYYVKAFPSLLTVWAWWDACPTGAGAASAIDTWAGLTEHGETSLPKQGGGIGTWSAGVYSGSPSGKAPVGTVLASIRADDTRFQEYFDGTRADPSPHGGWLEAFYSRVFAAARRPDITGSDHDEMEQKRQRALLLRFWKNVAKKFWERNGTTITTGYGTAKTPDYANLSRKDTLKAIGDFPTVSNAGAAEKAAAQTLLDGLKTLDPKLVPDSMAT